MKKGRAMKMRRIKLKVRIKPNDFPLSNNTMTP
jgi:hypothetical protein